MTMYRYTALMWSRTDCEAAAAARFLAAKLPEISPHAWRKAWDGAGLAIYHAGEHKGRMQTYRLSGERGAVLGRLFRNDYTSVDDDLDEFESQKCLETRGQHLINNYWGRYVAFLNEPSSGTRYVMRDPSGAFSCFHTPFRGVTIYFSDMQDAANFSFLPFTVNWDYMKAHIMFPMFQKTITGLNEVSEVLPAECVETTPFEKKSRFVWNPTEVSQTDVVEDPEGAATLLRETVMNTIGALAGCYDRVVHNLGGLDSSIVLACIAKAPKRPDITCATNFTTSPRGDERFYSRQVAERYGVSLLEYQLDYRKADLSKVFLSNRLATPPGFFECISLTGDLERLAREKNAEVFFYGEGGDGVFFQPPRNFGALDYIRNFGFANKFPKILMEASRYSRTSIYRTFCDMIRERLSPTACFHHVLSLSLKSRIDSVVNPEAVWTGARQDFLHPLLIPDERTAKGKYLHILCCAFFSHCYYDHWDTNYYAERVHAFLAQPIVELCLRIPVWVLTYGGVDRGLARRAFERDLPHDIILRRSKSTPDEYYRDIYMNNIDWIRDVLLHGNLVREGLLHGDSIEQVLDNKNPLLNVSPTDVLGYAALETWVQKWTGRPTDHVAEADIAI